MEKNQENEGLDAKLQIGLEDVYQSVVVWNETRNQPTLVTGYFEQGNMFEFTIDMKGSPFLHAYPAIQDGELVYQLITSDNDIESSFSAAVPPADVLTSTVEEKRVPGVGGEIDKTVALERVGDWNDTVIREEWISDQTSASSMYQCFVIPGDDIVSDELHYAFFALKMEESGYVADLIIINMDSGNIISLSPVYYDMTRPVPPYKSSGATMKSKFGLLNFVESL